MKMHAYAYLWMSRLVAGTDDYKLKALKMRKHLVWVNLHNPKREQFDRF